MRFPNQPKENPMNDKRIDFIGRWALAFFAVLVVLVGWIGNNIRAGQYDIIFQIGVNFAVGAAVICVTLTLIAYRLIKRKEESGNERN